MAITLTGATRRILPLVAASALVTTMLMVGAEPASAATSVEQPDVVSHAVDAPPLDTATFLQGLKELESSPVPREAILDAGQLFYRYSVPEGALTLPSAEDVEAAMRAGGEIKDDRNFAPFLTVHFSGARTAVGFNTVDQQALASGAAAGVAAALCAIPGVGWAACALIGVVVGVATTYIVSNGICSRGRTLWWYDVSGGSTVACRSSAPF